MPYFVINLVTSKIEGYCATETEGRERVSDMTLRTNQAHALLKRIGYSYVPDPAVKWIEG